MMLNRILFIVLIQLSLSCACVDAQSYFPPATPGVWDTISPSRLGWCNERIDSLYQLLAVNNTWREKLPAACLGHYWEEVPRKDDVNHRRM